MLQFSFNLQAIQNINFLYEFEIKLICLHLCFAAQVIFVELIVYASVSSIFIPYLIRAQYTQLSIATGSGPTVWVFVHRAITSIS